MVRQQTRLIERDCSSCREPDLQKKGGEKRAADPIALMLVAVANSDRIYHVFSRLLFLHAHRKASALVNEIPEESGQFRFLRTACLANNKGSVGLILAKPSDMRISIPLDLSSRPFIPLPCFIFSPLCSA